MIEFFDIIFIVISVFTILTAVLSLESRELMYGAMSLAASFLGIAGLFVLLNATFLAMLQILVFVGAIAVLLLFTVMLVRRDKWVQDGNIKTRLFGLVTAVILSLGLIFVGMISNLNNWFPNDIILSFIDIGNDMILNYSLVLNILAVVLGVSIIGALTMAKLDKGDKK